MAFFIKNIFLNYIVLVQEIDKIHSMISIQKSNHLKSIAILLMLFLHLFNRDYLGLYSPLVFVGSKPLVFYIAAFCDICVPVFAFVSGYGLYFKYKKEPSIYWYQNIQRLKRLYLNYWIVLVIFAVIVGYILGVPGYPGILSKFIFNVLALDPSYNGAWWFLTTYIFFVLTSKVWFRILNRYNPYLLFILFGIFYVVAFYFRSYYNFSLENVVAKWTAYQLINYFFTLFQFMLGAFALKYSWNEKVMSAVHNFKYKKLFLISAFLLIFLIHSLIINYFIAPFISTVFIFIFLQIAPPKSIGIALDFLTPHSTNLWLVHMFIFLIFFEKFVYSFMFAPIIFLVLVIICLFSSFLINLIYNQVLKAL